MRNGKLHNGVETPPQLGVENHRFQSPQCPCLGVQVWVPLSLDGKEDGMGR